MAKIYDVYCDESCHLENDHKKVMVIGAVWCLDEKKKEIISRLGEIKQKHGLPPHFETKWTKVSKGKQGYYCDLLDYFFDDDDLHFRALVILDKSILDHRSFAQDHDVWYYKMYFNMLKVLFSPDSKYNVYLDIKDTRGGNKVAKLHEILCNNMYDFSKDIIQKVQIMRSNESELLQLADMLIGAIVYANNNSAENPGKLAIVQRMRDRSGYLLTKSTLYREKKVNLLIWTPEGDEK